MRAAILEQVGAPLVVHPDVDIEEPRHGEVAVKVVHCGVCHSDLSIVDGTFPGLLPIILGHEAAGVVEAVGPGVTSLVVGDHVVLTPCAPCGTCPWCVRGEWSLCANSDALLTASHPDGGTRLSRGGDTVYRGMAVAAFAEQVIIQEAGAVKVPEGFPLDLACLIGCGVQTGVGAVINTAGVSEGDSVLVMGLGGVGLSVVQGARLAGATQIIVSDPVAERRQRALDLGATHALDPADDDLVTAAHDLSPHGIGVDWAFDAAGRSSLVVTGLDATRKGGTTVMVGVPGLDDPLTYPLPAVLAVGGKKLTGCLLGSSNALRDIPRLVDLAQAGRLDLAALVTARRPLEDINLALDDLRTGTGVRTVIDL
ncbi:MAG: Zn-dependent alcohol dehydrogenase [Microthrixaceae bacterium]|jgi:S-(hydroxymethyl)glutathione dehydrogenase/alcohol dehydrogenase|nr:Zn-dependent alcohol dehydrogenase [Microthrixaceae bacterium]